MKREKKNKKTYPVPISCLDDGSTLFSILLPLKELKEVLLILHYHCYSYGPTEATSFCTATEISPGIPVSV